MKPVAGTRHRDISSAIETVRMAKSSSGALRQWASGIDLVLRGRLGGSNVWHVVTQKSAPSLTRRVLCPTLADNIKTKIPASPHMLRHACGYKLAKRRRRL